MNGRKKGLGLDEAALKGDIQRKTQSSCMAIGVAPLRLRIWSEKNYNNGRGLGMWSSVVIASQDSESWAV